MFAQGKKLVSGTVYDNTGTVLPGASVIETGTKNATTTDFDGKFSLEVAVGGSIEVSLLALQPRQFKLQLRLQNWMFVWKMTVINWQKFR